MRIRAGFGVGRDPSLTACPGPTCCHECFSALQVSLHLSESHQHSAPEDGVVPSVVLRDAERVAQPGWDTWGSCQLCILLNSYPLGDAVSFCTAGKDRRKSAEFSL